MYYLIKTLSFLNNILLILAILIVVAHFANREYPLKKDLNKFLSKFKVPFDDQYKIFVVFLVPIVGQVILFILWRIFPSYGVVIPPQI